ncbi:NAD-dependent epimerase/dehydratase family protein [Verrucosispora sp. WMMD703]|uniref:NAD-dependent epimerase n=1 Tax=Micromonospora sediminimaris TaxID=547162 RepID=A0A9W5XK52_9ACTN|nr:NAD-dependent epimerase/dehydratase family protein [Micromonospora sediminimaris]GIJ32358.1 NAD-dependent epimerase [Micromonospora sediminimaris]SFD33452.1 Nucleoside-diphosphate-sugar epimerase [Micromonospora sediminimaris]
MATHLIVGAGMVGSTTARQLAERGEQVVIVSRSGRGPAHPRVERIAADASDADRLGELAEGVTAIYNCLNPAYHRWLTDWPPMAAALLTAAERSGAPLVIAGCIYGYGEITGPMTEENPLAATHPKLKMRADIWRAALAAQRAGRIRAVTEVRGSDYLQAQSIFSFFIGKPLLAGRRTFVPAPLDVPHTWTSINDMAAMLVTAATDERAWNRPWHVPSASPLTVRELATRFTEVAGAPAPKLTTIPGALFRAGGLLSPMLREFQTTAYQFARPFVMGSTAATATFGLRPQPLDEALRETAALLGGVPGSGHRRTQPSIT